MFWFHFVFSLQTIPLEDKVTWSNFDEFKKNSFAFYDVCFPASFDKNNWIDGYCECRDYHKSYICEHMIGIAARSRLVTVPPEAKAIPLGQKSQIEESIGTPRLAKTIIWNDTQCVWNLYSMILTIMKSRNNAISKHFHFIREKNIAKKIKHSENIIFYLAKNKFYVSEITYIPNDSTD